MESMIQIEIFKSRLQETVAWCQHRVDVKNPAHSLKSVNLQPPSRWLFPRLKTDWPTVVAAVADERAHWTNIRHKTMEQFSSGLAGGRLLLCTSATESIPDGGVTQLSNGFYDEEDMPPWDTWLCYLKYHGQFEDRNGVREYLVSWVPPEFVELAAIGVETHFMGCMYWAEDWETPFTKQLRHEGLIG